MSPKAFLHISAACVVERSRLGLPATPQHCYLPENTHLLTLENARAQRERNSWTWRQGAFLPWGDVTVDQTTGRHHYAGQQEVPASILALEVCGGVNHCFPMGLLSVGISLLPTFL